MGIFRQLIDRKTLKVLDLLIENKGKLFHLNKISEEAKVSISSTFRIIRHLVSIDLVDVVMVGKMKIYRISPSDRIKELEIILDEKSGRKKDEKE